MFVVIVVAIAVVIAGDAGGFVVAIVVDVAFVAVVGLWC